MEHISMRLPGNLEELVECLEEADENTGLISGGTDFVIQLRQRKLYSGTIIDLSRIEELRFIKEDDNNLRIGAATTLTEVSENELIKKYVPALAQAAGQVGSTQIRNRGTIAGNIGNASPCADTVPPLMAFDALLKVINGKGKIVEKTLDEVVFGSGRNNLKSDEVIIEIVIPKLNDNYISAFEKLGSRKAVTISKINGAVVVKYNSDKNIIEDARVFLGALGPKAFRSQCGEKALIDRAPTQAVLNDFCHALINQVDTAIGGRSSQAYKREAIKGIAHDIFNKLFESVVPGGDS